MKLGFNWLTLQTKCYFLDRSDLTEGYENVEQFTEEEAESVLVELVVNVFAELDCTVGHTLSQFLGTFVNDGN